MEGVGPGYHGVHGGRGPVGLVDGLLVVLACLVLPFVQLREGEEKYHILRWSFDIFTRADNECEYDNMCSLLFSSPSLWMWRDLDLRKKREYVLLVAQKHMTGILMNTTKAP